MKKYALVFASFSFALGCVLWARLGFSHEESTTTVEFDREIVHILDNHCVMCHAPNSAAFPLITYEQTYVVRRIMRMDALDHHMSPWGAIAGYGDFANANSLTLREISFIVGWAEGFGPRNNGVVGIDYGPHKVVEAHADFDKWTLGNPDQIVPLPETAIAASPSETVTRVTLDPKLTAGRWLRGIEYKPGNRGVVRAVYFTVAETGQWIGSWTPWYDHADLPDGLAYRLPAHAHLIAEIHSLSPKMQASEAGSVGLYFAGQPSPAKVSDLSFDLKGDTAATGSMERFRAETRLAEETNVLAVKPRIHPGVDSIQVSALLPDGATRVLLFAHEIPVEWPTPYIYKNPVPLPKGSRVSVIEYYKTGELQTNSDRSLVLSTYEGPELKPASAVETAAEPEPAAPSQRYQLVGVVRSVDAEGRSLLVQHEAIPGFMGAMTMQYQVGSKENLGAIKAGDHIHADLVVSGSDMQLENIKKAGQ